MKQLPSIAALFLGVGIGYTLPHGSKAIVYGPGPHVGDEVMYDVLAPYADTIQNCNRLTLLSTQQLDSDTVAWVLFEECYLDDEYINRTTGVVSLKYLEKK